MSECVPSDARAIERCMQRIAPGDSGVQRILTRSSNPPSIYDLAMCPFLDKGNVRQGCLGALRDVKQIDASAFWWADYVGMPGMTKESTTKLECERGKKAEELMKEEEQESEHIFESDSFQGAGNVAKLNKGRGQKKNNWHWISTRELYLRDNLQNSAAVQEGKVELVRKAKTGYQLYHMYRVAELKKILRLSHQIIFRVAARDWTSLPEYEKLWWRNRGDKKPLGRFPSLPVMLGSIREIVPLRVVNTLLTNFVQLVDLCDEVLHDDKPDGKRKRRDVFPSSFPETIKIKKEKLDSDLVFSSNI